MPSDARTRRRFLLTAMAAAGVGLAGCEAPGSNPGPDNDTATHTGPTETIYADQTETRTTAQTTDPATETTAPPETTMTETATATVTPTETATQTATPTATTTEEDSNNNDGGSSGGSSGGGGSGGSGGSTPTATETATATPTPTETPTATPTETPTSTQTPTSTPETTPTPSESEPIRLRLTTAKVTRVEGTLTNIGDEVLAWMQVEFSFLREGDGEVQYNRIRVENAEPEESVPFDIHWGGPGDDPDAVEIRTRYQRDEQ